MTGQDSRISLHSREEREKETFYPFSSSLIQSRSLGNWDSREKIQGKRWLLRERERKRERKGGLAMDEWQDFPSRARFSSFSPAYTRTIETIGSKSVDGCVCAKEETERGDKKIKGSREKERGMWRSDRVENRDAECGQPQSQSGIGKWSSPEERGEGEKEEASSFV